MITTEFPTTAQAVFDHAARHLIEQGKQSRFADDPSARCAYRGANDGEACSVGCLIPQAYYTREMEGLNIGGLLVNKCEFLLSPLRVFLEAHERLLGTLQIMHDEDAPARWRQELRLVAERFGLSAAILDTLPAGPAEGGA